MCYTCIGKTVLHFHITYVLKRKLIYDMTSAADLLILEFANSVSCFGITYTTPAFTQPSHGLLEEFSYVTHKLLSCIVS